jgi:ArsR family transcriptional regulator
MTSIERISLLADGVRSRALLAVSSGELTVSELCEVLDLPQSTVSRHLKILADSGWATSRPEGTRRLYRLAERDDPARSVWDLARAEIESSPGGRQDALRLERVLARRRDGSRRFFEDGAERWDHRREELFGSRSPLVGLLGLLDPGLTVADLGCGTGVVADLLSGFVRRVVAVDDSDSMLEASRHRLAGRANVEVRKGQLEELPLEPASVDAATLILVLHHLPDPARALAEVARILRPGGRLILVDMLPHDRDELRREMGHVWLGFARERIERLALDAGLELVRFADLPLDAQATGPGLFTALASAPGTHKPGDDLS